MRSGGVAPHINRFNNRWNMSCQPRASERAPDRYSVGGCESLFLSGLFGEERYRFSLGCVGPVPVWPLWRREISLLLGLDGPYSCLASLKKRNISSPWAVWALSPVWPLWRREISLLLGLCGPFSCLACLEKRSISFPCLVSNYCSSIFPPMSQSLHRPL